MYNLTNIFLTDKMSQKSDMKTLEGQERCLYAISSEQLNLSKQKFKFN